MHSAKNLDIKSTGLMKDSLIESTEVIREENRGGRNSRAA
jgi:hypothetical protein